MIHFKPPLWALAIVLVLGATQHAVSQNDEPGFSWVIAAGTGFSTHAGSYRVPLDFSNDYKEFSGYRIFTLETRLGWRISRKTAVYATGNASPGNTTISPYRSFYAGLGVSQGFGLVPRFYIKGGAGYYQAGLGGGEAVGNGILPHIGLGYYFSQKFHIEMNTMFGKINPDANLDPNPFVSSEFQVYFAAAYDIF